MVPWPDGIYQIRQNALSIGRIFRIYDGQGSQVGYAKHPILRLLEENALYADDSESEMLICSRREALFQINFSYLLSDGATGVPLGIVRRMSFRSLWRDHLQLLAPDGTQVGSIEETGYPLVRRLLPFWPYSWRIELGGTEVATITQQLTLFAKTLTLDTSGNNGLIAPQAAVICALLLMHEVHGAATENGSGFSFDVS